MSAWINRREFPFPYQDVSPFERGAIVQIKNTYGDSRIGPSDTFWWGYDYDDPEGMIAKARRLDRPKRAKT